MINKKKIKFLLDKGLQFYEMWWLFDFCFYEQVSLVNMGVGLFFQECVIYKILCLDFFVLYFVMGGCEKMVFSRCQFLSLEKIYFCLLKVSYFQIFFCISID